MHPMDKVIASLADLSSICQAQREAGEKVVLTSGCFDLLHGGHLEYICDAGELGYLVVGINSDAFVRRLKGDNRPIRGQDDRAFMMAGFFPVNLVSIFNCDYELIEAVRPNIYVASATSHVRVWEDTQRVALLENMGTRIVEIESKKTDSTTDIIQRAAI
jgi:rfaE bifunctional protein nucleotidyltransferase chain/domain